MIVRLVKFLRVKGLWLGRNAVSVVLLWSKAGGLWSVVYSVCGGGLYRAAAANWFLRLGELGSVERALAANSSLLEDMEMVFRLVTTCV